MTTYPSAYSIQLTDEQRDQLHQLIRRGRLPARTVTRALTLQALDAGEPVQDIVAHLSICDATVRNIAKRYLADGLEAALYDRPRPGQPKRYTAKDIQQVTALVCGPPPEGFARWTLHQIARELKRRKLLARGVSHETVRSILKNHDLQPWREKNVVRSEHHR